MTPVRSARPAGTSTTARVGPWLVVRFHAPHAVASWAIVGGGLGTAKAVVWRQVSEGDLRPPVDAASWLRARMHREGLAGAVGLLTSRDLDAWVEAVHDEDGARVRCVATVGLGNALRAGDPPGPSARIGTINTLAQVGMPLSPNALLEALAVAAEAKTAAVLESGALSRRTGLAATGTGTDCIVVAAPITPGAVPYAGKHTAVGSAIGAAVFDAVRRGAGAWIRDRGLP
jgi:adenosylcobinamide amidohydrolase